MSSKGNKRVARKVHDISPSASESETEEKEVKSRNISAPKTGQNKKKSSSYSIDEKALLDVLKKKFGHDGKLEFIYSTSNLAVRFRTHFHVIFSTFRLSFCTSKSSYSLSLEWSK